jgi:hypothetical protein
MTADGPWGTPVHAPDPSDDQCWDTPLPCLPWHYLDSVYLKRVRWRTLITHAAVSPAVTGYAVAFKGLPTRVNAGGTGYTDSAGQVWQCDMGAQQGWAMSTTAAISGTTNPKLYQTARYSDTGILGYQFAIPNGDYAVTLKFAEIWWPAETKREFDIALNGTLVAQRFDITKAAGGRNRAWDLQYAINVTDGELNIILTGVTRQPLINGIEILPMSNAAGARTE